MKRLLIIATILAAGVAGADDLPRYGQYKGPEYTIELFHKRLGCGKDRMHASQTAPGVRGKFMFGCWEPRGELVHIEYSDGTTEVVPHSAFTLAPKFRKRWWL